MLMYSLLFQVIMDGYLITCLIIGTTFVAVTNPQHAPPGVNPNTYQHQQVSLFYWSTPFICGNKCQLL